LIPHYYIAYNLPYQNAGMTAVYFGRKIISGIEISKEKKPDQLFPD